MAILFFCLSLTPSLLPRGWVLQAVAGGITAALGYGLGATGGWVVRRLVGWRFGDRWLADRFGARVRRRAWIGLAIVAVGLLAWFLWMSVGWQDEVRRLMGLGPVMGWYGLLIALVAALVLVVFLLFARVVRLGSRTVARWLSRYVSVPVATAAGVLVGAVVVVGFVQGFLYNGFISAANQAASLANGLTTEGTTAPTSRFVTGGPESLVGWQTLGHEGRDFTGRVPTVAELSRFAGHPAKEPIRVYVGLDSADSLDAQAELAVRELERTGAFSRSVLAVITTTGTGWVDSKTSDSLEYLYAGDTAEVAMQYSYLPSWVSFIVDKSKAAQAGAALNDAVLSHWLTLPPQSRPKLVVAGESLGSYGTEEAFGRLPALATRTSGALLIGPPAANPIHTTLTEGRDPASVAWRPVYDDGRTVQFANRAAELPDPAPQWIAPRVAYLQHGSDPVVWWNAELLFGRPDWLASDPAPDVTPTMRWYPIVTFWQVLVDMATAGDAPPGHGHNYGAEPAAGWAAVIPPPGWTSADTQRLVAQFR